MTDPIHPPRALSAPGRRLSRVASICTLLALQVMRSSPATQASSIRDVVIVCSRRPVSGSVFVDSAVRMLSWNAGPAAGAKKGVRGVFMASIVFLRLLAVIPNASQLLGVGATALCQGVNHG